MGCVVTGGCVFRTGVLRCCVVHRPSKGGVDVRGWCLNLGKDLGRRRGRCAR
ncbi:hypothetical protein CU044_3269 [Streptomyces sp. L-9-10]|nr:hypothetical protein CU044_3269 [Streptomyces sp. L-9-10]